MHKTFVFGGHRYDSIPFANGMITAGMSCQLSPGIQNEITGSLLQERLTKHWNLEYGIVTLMRYATLCFQHAL